jgi:sulfatase modifying factor 1
MSNCGPCAESCCASVAVLGGTYDRTYGRGGAGADPATVSSFRLDKYEVTVGRFRQFAQAWRRGWRPAAESGKHTHLNAGSGLVNIAEAAGSGGPVYETGWLPSHDGLAQFPSPGTTATWTADAGANENLPINWINWYTAYAFCIWDDGFLSSEAEWEYAAAGGDESRAYPWGNADPGLGYPYATYNCFYPNPSTGGPGTCIGTANLAPVGTAALGGGKWGQLDLAGNVYEWNLDWCSGVSDVCASSYVSPCVDCAYLDPPTSGAERVQRGGGYDDPAAPQLSSEWRHANKPGEAYSNYGIRCARTP